MHFHFGKDGGAERFFVHLVNAMGRRHVEQQVIIRRDRVWRKEIEQAASITESNFRNASLDRVLLPLRVQRTANLWQPDGIMAWMPRAATLVPRRAKCLRIARLGDYPRRLGDFRNIDTLVCNTPGIMAHVKQLGWKRGLQTISNFTCTDRVEPISREALDTPGNAPLICSMGRFVPRKGFDVLIRALQQLDDAYLWIIGDGDEAAHLKSLARDLKVHDRVRFAGWRPDPRPYVAASDVFAMASSHEPLGNVILEAWAQCVPVVSTRVEGPQWFMRDRQNGLMVDIGDHAGFAKAFREIFDNDQLARHLVQHGQSSLKNQFSEEAVVQSYLNLFSSSAAVEAFPTQARKAA